MKIIPSTIAGIVSDVLVEKADVVKKGQKVIIIESMKMHIPIESEGEGIVSEVRVNKGDFINDGDVLLILE